MSGAPSKVGAVNGGDVVSAGGDVWVRFLDDDPLRAYREARELGAELRAVGVGVEFARRVAEPADDASLDKGGPVVEAISLVLSGASLGVAVLQAWLSRTPTRRVRVERPDGTVLDITGRAADGDPDLVNRFLASTGDTGPHPAPDPTPPGAGSDGHA